MILTRIKKNKKIRKTSLIFKNKGFTHITRKMHRVPFYLRSDTTLISRRNSLWNTFMHTRSATTSVVKFSKKASTDLACDEKGSHSHLITKVCTQPDCEQKKCLSLCDQIKKIDSKGHFTHKPVAGKFCKFICDKDGNKQDKTQYYIKNTDKTKSIDGQKAQTYDQTGALKTKKDMEQYILDNNLQSKLE